MIHAAFFVKNGRQAGFTVSGHSGLADPGADILCAAVSAMTSSLTPFSASRAATQRSLSASTTPTGLDSAP